MILNYILTIGMFILDLIMTIVYYNRTAECCIQENLMMFGMWCFILGIGFINLLSLILASIGST